MKTASNRLDWRFKLLGAGACLAVLIVGIQIVAAAFEYLFPEPSAPGAEPRSPAIPENLKPAPAPVAREPVVFPAEEAAAPGSDVQPDGREVKSPPVKGPPVIDLNALAADPMEIQQKQMDRLRQDLAQNTDTQDLTLSEERIKELERKGAIIW